MDQAGEKLIGDGNQSKPKAANPQQFKHPVITLSTIVLRIAPLIVYLFCGLFSDSYIGNFVAVVIFLSLDFWTVKNISGRFMVGLRWWNYIDAKGDSHWIFESREPELNIQNDPSEVMVFWLTLVTLPAIWLFFFIIALFSFKFRWLLLLIIAVSMSFANLYGYLKCRFGRSSITSSVSTATRSFVRNTIIDSVTAVLTNPNRDQASKPTQQV